MSTSTTAPIAPVREIPTGGEIASTMVRYTVWCIVAGALLEEVTAMWRGGRR